MNYKKSGKSAIEKTGKNRPFYMTKTTKQ